MSSSIGKTVFGVVVSNRAFFNPAIALTGRKEVLKLLDSLGIEHVIQPENATASGCVENFADAQLLASVFKQNRDRIDGILVVLPTFGDEVAVVETIRLANLNVPVLVQACNDDPSKVGVKERRDAFCGKISVCNNLFQYGIPFTDTTYHTCAIASGSYKKDILRFADICRVVKGVKTLRVGLIGTRPQAFQTVRFSEKLLQKYGITTVPIDLSEILAAISAIKDDDARVREKVTALRAYGEIEKNVIDSNIIKEAKFSIAVENFVGANELSAVALQCWNSLEANFGCAACVTMSMLGDINGIPCACEADITGAVSMYILGLASKNASALLDWNNNYNEETDICVNTHCSNYPKSFFANDIRIGNLDLLGETFGGDRCFGAVKGQVKKGEMTYFRISTDDTKGAIKAYLGEGEFIEKPFNMDGGIALCQIPHLRRLLATITQNGFEHHVAMARSHSASVIHEAVGKYLKWNIYWHNGEEQIVRL